MFEFGRDGHFGGRVGVFAREDIKERTCILGALFIETINKEFLSKL